MTSVSVFDRHVHFILERRIRIPWRDTSYSSSSASSCWSISGCWNNSARRHWKSRFLSWTWRFEINASLDRITNDSDATNRLRNQFWWLSFTSISSFRWSFESISFSNNTSVGYLSSNNSTTRYIDRITSDSLYKYSTKINFKSKSTISFTFESNIVKIRRITSNISEN